MPRSAPASAPIRFVLVTLDAHLAGAAERAAAALTRDPSPVELRLHVAADWMRDPSTIAACRADIAAADVVLVTQLFMEEQVAAIREALAARREAGAMVVCAICAPELMRLTRLGRFDMGDTRAAGPWSPVTIIRRLLGGRPDRGSAGQRQMAALRSVPKLLRFVPGPAQDVRAYYLVLQYWLAGSSENIANLVRLLVARHAPHAGSPRAVAPPVEYPEVGVYHPALAGRVADDAAALGHAAAPNGRVGLLVQRSYVLAGNTAHYDAVIRALEARGLSVVPAFASALDNRPAVERFFLADGRATIDALVSLTGFSLVGGPAYSDAPAARLMLERLDVPYLCVQALEFQSIEEWHADGRGLNSLQATLQIAIPELEGATNPIVFAGKSSNAAGTRDAATRPIAERVTRLADRVAKLVALRRVERRDRKVAIVLFNFPPNAGNAGTAAYLDVFASLARVLDAMRAQGYTVDAPSDPAELRRRVVEGNAERNGTLANVHVRVSADAHVRREPWLADIEATWGPAPGRQLSDGASVLVMGERFGNVFVGVQPGFGYEGDPMRLLFERGFAPTHAFSAFYRWIREDFGADVALHFGTHGALEFMPGKQTGLDATCWPDRLIGDLPNVYLYASNNPSEGTLAKRRGAATLVSYLTPPVTNAGLYRGLLDLKATLDRLGGLAFTPMVDVDPGFRRGDEQGGIVTPMADVDPGLRRDDEQLYVTPAQAGVHVAHQTSDSDGARAALLVTAQRQAVDLELAAAAPEWTTDDAPRLDVLRAKLLELEYALIPDGLHAVGRAPSPEQRVALLAAMARDARPDRSLPSLVEALGDPSDDAARDAVRRWVIDRSDAGMSEPARTLVAHLRTIDALLVADHETTGVLRALDGRFIAPAPGGDLLRNSDVLPTGRNVFGFDPYRVPSATAMREGAMQAERLLARHAEEHGGLPESVAMVLWGTDNMKSDGSAIAQVLALLGAEPHFDGLGRLNGARLVPLEALGRPRVDVVITLSGVFRDLFPLQIRLLAEAALLAAEADEPLDSNPVRRHALATQAATGCDLETAALRVFGNAEGAYGANVNLLVDSGAWQDETELGTAFATRKGFAYGRDATATARPELFARALAGVELSYQMVDSVELGATDVDQYVDSLGGLSRAVRSARGREAPVYMGDTTGAEGKVRTLDEQVAFESRTRLLNPRWHEGMLRSGYEGVREISSRVTTTLGWSATTGAVPAWVYRDVCDTFVTDDAMRERLAALNPHATLQMTGRLLEANDRGYWTPDDATLDALRAANAELEDRIEGVFA